ncbi:MULTISPECIES: 4Fe-4S binding protein [Yersinia]|uniref:4Fe-4S binding protein n=1 Tax=Yersinia TaxID=629 RepID=UPI000FFC6A89|nr:MULTISPECIES: 4Fe-4S binding protein [Yersinia]RXA93937.1 ferredoxin [Yersinia sp. 2105 StPb PI]
MARDERYYKAYLESRVISRRGLFRGLLKGAAGGAVQTTPPTLPHPILTNPCQNTYIYCNSCTDFCDKQALLWHPRQPPTLIDQQCDGCGECVARCPAMALEMSVISPSLC